MDALFRPKSVAVIGASDRELTIGYRIIRNLREMRFRGCIYPVNPKGVEIQGLTTHRSILEVPGEVDLAHIVVKNTMVPQVLTDCARKGVKVCIINTAGFKEIGPVGASLEDELVRITRQTGIRVFGPNCQGIINADPEVNAYCNFTFTKPEPGFISIFSQSGGVGEAINNRLVELGEGLRMYASSGNVCDIQCTEILTYWKDDPGTKVIVCHLETISDPDLFIKVVRKVSSKKPILAMITGQTDAGARAVACHTGGIAKDRGREARVLRKSGMLPCSSFEELCQAARSFVHLPLPHGNRVGIITNTGGPGVIAADELVNRGCEISELTEKTKADLRGTLLPEAIVSNPIDMLATANAQHFAATLSAMLSDPNVDSLLVNFITPFFVNCEAVAHRIAEVWRKSEKPIMCVVMTEKTHWAPTLKIFRDAGLPIFEFPEIAATALAKLTAYGLQGKP